MATLTLQVVVGANTYTNTKTVSNADAARLANALRVAYNQPSATDAQAMTLWAGAVFDQAKTIVRDAEGNAAKAAVVDIALT
jgi:hypothetical protein